MFRSIFISLKWNLYPDENDWSVLQEYTDQNSECKMQNKENK